MINLHKSTGPGRDWAHDHWICSQTCIWSQTRYWLRYAPPFDQGQLQQLFSFFGGDRFKKYLHLNLESLCSSNTLAVENKWKRWSPVNSLPHGKYFLLLCCLPIFFQNPTLSKNSFRITIRVSNRLDPDQAHNTRPDLGPICLQRLWADDTNRQRVKMSPMNFLIFQICCYHINCGYSKELSKWDDSFEHPKRKIWLMEKEIISSSWSKHLLFRTYMYYVSI